MADKNLVKYIKDCLSLQAQRQEIEEALLAAGWEGSQIEEGFREVERLANKKKPLKFGLSIAIVMICLIAAGLAVYWIKTEPVDQPDSNIIITKPADETAGWQTFTDSQYGFELKYPKDWQENSATSTLPNFNKGVNIIKNGLGIDVDVFSNDKILAPLDWYKEVLLGQEFSSDPGTPKYDGSEDQINNFSDNGIRIVTPWYGYNMDRVFIGKNKIIVRISTSYPDDETVVGIKDLKDEFNQILSTFKFIN